MLTGLFPRFLLASALLAAAVAAQRRWVVDSTRGSHPDFVDLTRAVAAAEPGDRIEVRGEGPHGVLSLKKGVDVEATDRARLARIEIAELPVDETARVAGFVVVGAPDQIPVAVRKCAGPVSLVSLEVTRRVPTTARVATPALAIDNSPRVTVLGGTWVGGHGVRRGAPALRCDESQVVLCGGSFTGGVTIGATGVGEQGEVGIELLRGTEVFAFAAVCRGTDGGGDTLVGGHGGHGIYADPWSTGLLVSGCSITGGAAGGGSFVSGRPGDACHGAIRVSTDCEVEGAFSEGASRIAARAVVVGPPAVAPGETAGLRVRGPAGARVLLCLDGRRDFRHFDELDGPFLLSTGWSPLEFVTLDDEGEGAHDIEIPFIEALRERDVFVQGIADAGGEQPHATPPYHLRIR